MFVKIAAAIAALSVLTGSTLLVAWANAPSTVFWAFVLMIWPAGILGTYLTFKL